MPKNSNTITSAPATGRSNTKYALPGSTAYTTAMPIIPFSTLRTVALLRSKNRSPRQQPALRPIRPVLRPASVPHQPLRYNHPVKARTLTGMARWPRRFDLQPQRILITIDANLDYALDVTRCRALVP